MIDIYFLVFLIDLETIQKALIFYNLFAKVMFREHLLKCFTHSINRINTGFLRYYKNVSRSVMCHYVNFNPCYVNLSPIPKSCGISPAAIVGKTSCLIVIVLS